MSNTARIVSGEKVYRVLYYSKASLGEGGADAAQQYAQILEASRRNNGRIGVTGALMISGDRFAQVLEGPEAAVRGTYERIKLDPRHRYSTVVDVAPNASRIFAAWAMAMAGAAPGEAISLSHHASLEAAIVDPVNGGDQIIEILRGLARKTVVPGQIAA